MTVESAELLTEVGEPVVRAEVRRARRSLPQRVLILRARPVWRGPATLLVGDQAVRVVPAVSALAVREALATRDGDEALVVLTDRPHDDLGPGILARAVEHTVVVPNQWQAVLSLFDATELDPTLPARDRWLPDAALTLPGTPRPAPRGELTRAHALGEVLRLRVGLDARDLDAASLLEWTTQPDGIRGFADLPPAVRDGLAAWLADQAGPVGSAVTAAARAGFGADAIALGLVADVLWPEPEPRLSSRDRTAVIEARTKFTERYLTGVTAPATVAAAWGRAAVAWVERVTTDATPDAAVSTLGRAEALLDGLGATRLATRSAVLPQGLGARLRELGAALHALPDPMTADDLTAVETGLSDVVSHATVGRSARAWVETATMAVRLARWLATRPGPGDTLVANAARYLADGAWADRARDRVWTGTADSVLAQAYRRLYERAAVVRDEMDRGFAASLAAVGAAPAAPLLGVEGVLPQIVAPLTRSGGRVLLVVVDGMPAATATRLAEEIRGARFSEVVPAGGAGRAAALSVLPSVTSVSRTSLLTGRLTAGSQGDEKRDLPAAAGAGSRVFHKAELVAGPGMALAPEVATAVADQGSPVVAVVLNQIDDALKADAGPAREWSLDALPPLRALLEAAYAAGRSVVLTADHGHVLDRGAGMRDATGDPESARWRPATAGAPAGPDEVTVTGSRVLLGGGSVVLPWRESLRYTGKQAGYHGGAALAEVIVPVLVFVTDPVHPPAGWQLAAPQQPPWWLDPLPVASAAGTGATSTTQTFVSDETSTTGSLFEVVEQTADVPPAQSLGRRVVAGDVYAAQKARAGRQRDLDDRVVLVVDNLLDRGGRVHATTLAALAGIPEHRIVQTLSVLRRVLNVEGYPVLGVDVDNVTVVLDEPLLREQFGLEGS